MKTLPLGLGALALSLLAFACDKPTEPTAQDETATEIPLVRIGPVLLQQVQQEIVTTAYLEAEHQVMVNSMIAGRIQQVQVEEGDSVKAGQELLVLDSREAQSAKAQVEIQLEDRKLRLELAELEVEASQRRVKQAAITRDRLQGDYRRFEKLDEELVSEKQIEESRYAWKSAEEALQEAQFNQKKTKLDVRTASQAIHELEARLQESKVKLSDHHILAPLDGVVARRMVRGGETITPSSELLQVVDTDNLISYLSRPQRELELVQKAESVVFSTDSHPDKWFTADVDLISAVVDQDTGSFRIRIRVRRNDAATLRPGMFIRARILTEEQRPALMVPRTAIAHDGDDSVLFLLKDQQGQFGMAHRHVVETGLENDSHVEIRNAKKLGITVQDKIIVSGHQRLQDQSKVEVSLDE